MLFKIISAVTLRCLPPRVIFQCSHKKNNKLLKLVTAPQLSSCRQYSGNAFSEVFDLVPVQNYLNYIVSKGFEKNFVSQDAQKLHNLLETKRELENEIKNLETMSSESDKELEKLIESERKQYLESIEEIKNEILYLIFPNDDNDNRNVELKIVSGIGGEEAKLFAAELFDMYINYAEYKNWEYTGDIKDGFILINGECVFGHLKYEAGVHRVQRVPVTENSGRVQSSTCSVVVLPQPRPHEIEIPERDVTIERLKSCGPGGQNVNKKETRVRIKHLPTGITLENQTSRFQYQNLKEALNRLRGILFNMEQEKILSERKSFLKEQAGTNDYSDKIRTYNFPQNRVTDHRINFSIQNLKGFLSGGQYLDDVIKQVKRSNLKNELLFHIRDTLNSAEYKTFEKKQSV